MRVKCRDIYDFLNNIQSEKKGSIFRNIIYIDRAEQPLDGTKEKAVKFLISISLHAVIDISEEGGQYLLEMQQDCGVDYHDASKEFNGSSKLKAILGKLEEFCAKEGLSLRSGVVDF